ncbi:hypothetical protein [Piscinibacter sp. HJYY11]|uniref:hypothetical protein n=1 Tax=Piscinibacter sp. HJYY11 TaxID=2801333 RepID=UPI00191DAF0F|nr:hypothetical protein [Piscinibacter sp. HJYY11]MBL0726641.1 hypothetical protein [Piscinibacter sp. HJYY11]
MIAAIWIVFAVLLAVWTAAVWLASAVTNWAADALQAAGGIGAIRVPEVVALLPAWLRDWIPGDLLELLPGILASIQQAAQSIESVLPWAGTAIGWLAPILWVTWALVTLAMLVVTLVIHVAVRRSRRVAAPTAV